jgi:hypothetical protein
MAFSNQQDSTNCEGYKYDEKSISDELITEIFIEFSSQTRREESDEYIRTLTGWSDNIIGKWGKQAHQNFTRDQHRL